MAPSWTASLVCLSLVAFGGFGPAAAVGPTGGLAPVFHMWWLLGCGVQPDIGFLPDGGFVPGGGGGFVPAGGVPIPDDQHFTPWPDNAEGWTPSWDAHGPWAPQPPTVLEVLTAERVPRFLKMVITGDSAQHEEFLDPQMSNSFINYPQSGKHLTTNKICF